MTARISIPSQQKFLPVIRAFAYDLVRSLGIEEKVAHRTEFIVSELCSNAVEHGRKEGGEVRVALKFENGDLMIECQNDLADGLSASQLSEKYHAEMDPVAARGRGLFIIRQWVKDAHFEDRDGSIRISVIQSLSE